MTRDHNAVGILKAGRESGTWSSRELAGGGAFKGGQNLRMSLHEEGMLAIDLKALLGQIEDELPGGF